MEEAGRSRLVFFLYRKNRSGVESRSARILFTAETEEQRAEMGSLSGSMSVDLRLGTMGTPQSRDSPHRQSYSSASNSSTGSE